MTMARVCSPCILIALALVALVADVRCSPPCERIQAAFSYDDNIYIAIGESVVKMNLQNEVQETFPAEELNFDQTLTAAFRNEREFFLISNKADTGYFEIGRSFGMSFLRMFDLESIFRDETDFQSIDAAMATEQPDDVMLFVGCSHATVSRRTPWITPALVPNSKVGLPCDVDAAVFNTQEELAIVFKGDKFWEFNKKRGTYNEERDITDMSSYFNKMNLCSD